MAVKRVRRRRRLRTSHPHLMGAQDAVRGDPCDPPYARGTLDDALYRMAWVCARDAKWSSLWVAWSDIDLIARKALAAEGRPIAPGNLLGRDLPGGHSK